MNPENLINSLLTAAENVRNNMPPLPPSTVAHQTTIDDYVRNAFPTTNGRRHSIVQTLDENNASK